MLAGWAAGFGEVVGGLVSMWSGPNAASRCCAAETNVVSTLPSCNSMSARERDPEKLHRRAPIEPPVAARGEPHAAHPTLANGRDERIRADGLSRVTDNSRQHRIAFEEPLVGERRVLVE